MARSRVAQARRIAYRTGTVLGHVRAVQSGRIGQRIINILLGRLISRGTSRLWR